MVFVATEEFVDAAAGQSRALAAELGSVFVSHPVQDRTEEELVAMADGAVDALVAALVVA